MEPKLAPCGCAYGYPCGGHIGWSAFDESEAELNAIFDEEETTNE